ncbi:interleukin-6 receptor subunit alpha isoform X2 [Heterocephalus glaber]|nr:interleukin-6 receptor subunit alpha isoform X2 [Heterocephalus glaber]XP_021104966.1 interleukin-6 receptor subunit alpha isoform X2 [Heterocephalus glaber]
MRREVQTSLPGANVSLPCPAADLREDNSVYWVVSDAHARLAGVGRRLLLTSVQPSDSGNYSCYADGRLAGTVRLLVEAPPEQPQLSCWRRSLLGSVVCEWSPRNAPSLTTKAELWVRKLQTHPMEESQEPCLYSRESRKFFCQFPVPEGDTSIRMVSVCVANSAGSSVSSKETVQVHKILKPDPPVGVTVAAVAGHPRWLNVTWKDPSSWDSDFYRLHFELRYRAEQSGAFTSWRIQTQDPTHQCIIPDALRGHWHVVQLRAREEFGIGSWSEWSPEARGAPWTAPRASPATPHSTKVSMVGRMRSTMELEVGLTLDRKWFHPTSPWARSTVLTTDEEDPGSPLATSLPVQVSFPAPLPAFLVAGGSLAFGSLLCIGLVLRFKRTWRARAVQECKQSVPPKPTLALAPLLSSLGSDNTSSQSRPDARDPRGPFDVSNRDYFFPR